jgi:hypothetical protein
MQSDNRDTVWPTALFPVNAVAFAHIQHACAVGLQRWIKAEAAICAMGVHNRLLTILHLYWVIGFLYADLMRFYDQLKAWRLGDRPA